MLHPPPPETRPDLPSLAIVGAHLIDDGGRRQVDVLIEAGRISRIGTGLATDRADRVLDAGGCYLLPGCIDDQVHFREPGLTHKACIRSEARAAVAGGTTTFMEMPNTQPTTTTLTALADKYARAARGCVANHAFYFGASNDNLSELRRLRPDSTCGVKVFMGSSTGNMLVDAPAVLAGIFRDSPMLIATHCEDTPMIRAAEAAARSRYGEAVPMRQHPHIRSRQACLASSRLAVDLARAHDARLHVLHLTTKEELALFRSGAVSDKRITCEACVHHLWFSEHDYATHGTGIKCNPAIKEVADRAALRQALNDDRIDVIATDHAPHLWSEKQNDYFKAPAGLPLIQHSLLALLELAAGGVWSLETVVKKCANAVADLFQIRDRGYVREGFWADLVIVDPQATTPVRRADCLSRCGWSPFEGQTFRHRIRQTIVSGHIAYDAGRVCDQVSGLPLRYCR